MAFDYQARLRRVRDNLDELGLRQAVICDPMSIQWLCGWHVDPGERLFALVVRAAADPVLVVNDLFPVPATVPFETRGFSDTDDPTPIVVGLLDPAQPLGVDKDLPARFLLPIQACMHASLRLASPAVDRARSRKDEAERALMRAASAVNDAAMAQLVTFVHESVTEREVAERLLGVYRGLGAQGHSFPPIVSFGAHAADPHHMPDDTRLAPGDVVLFDVGCVREGYCSDMTRTFFFRSVTDAQRRVYDVVRRANEAAAALARPGVLFSDLDGRARGVITEAGYGPYFTHRLGHQIGLTDHEPGDVSASHHEPIEPGVCFSIEPGVYLPGDFGVRIEDLAIMGEETVEIINAYPHDLVVLP